MMTNGRCCESTSYVTAHNAKRYPRRKVLQRYKAQSSAKNRRSAKCNRGVTRRERARRVGGRAWARRHARSAVTGWDPRFDFQVAAAGFAWGQGTGGVCSVRGRARSVGTYNELTASCQCLTGHFVPTMAARCRDFYHVPTTATAPMSGIRAAIPDAVSSRR